jgi:hypothetical protein
MPAHSTAPSKLTDGFEFISTPDPGQLAFRVRVDANSFNPTTLLEAGTPYKSCSFIAVKPRMGSQGFEDYVYTYNERSDQFIWFYFGYKKSPDEKNTPFRTFTTNQEYPWPAVLEDLYFVQSSFAQSVWDGLQMQTTPTILPRYRFRPSVSVDSLCVVEQFLDAVPWPQQDLEHVQPIPTEINASYIGADVSFPRCLHGKVVIKEFLPNARIVYGAGMVQPAPGRSISEMTFPATNFTDWAPFTLEDRQQPTGGMFLRERITIYPPEVPTSILR